MAFKNRKSKMNISALPRQSVLDIVQSATGGIESLIDICYQNNISPTEFLHGGETLCYTNTHITNRQVSNYFSRNAQPAMEYKSRKVVGRKAEWLKVCSPTIATLFVYSLITPVSKVRYNLDIETWGNSTFLRILYNGSTSSFFCNFPYMSNIGIWSNNSLIYPTPTITFRSGRTTIDLRDNTLSMMGQSIPFQYSVVGIRISNASYNATKARYGAIYFDDVETLTPILLTSPLPATLDSQGKARPAGECGMWDSVSQKFYGIETTAGSFTVEELTDEYVVLEG